MGEPQAVPVESGEESIAVPAPADDLDSFQAPADDGMGFDAPAPVEEPAPAPADMSNAFVTTQSMVDSPALAAWREANQKRLSERAAKSGEELTKLNNEAKAERDRFYEQRKMETEATAKANKEEEELSKKSKVELQAKGDGKDISRMQSVMISMKNA